MTSVCPCVNRPTLDYEITTHRMSANISLYSDIWEACIITTQSPGYQLLASS